MTIKNRGRYSLRPNTNKTGKRSKSSDSLLRSLGPTHDINSCGHSQRSFHDRFALCSNDKEAASPSNFRWHITSLNM